MLSRLKIRSKLVAVLLPPVAALAVLAAIVVRPLLSDVSDARAVTRYAQLAATVNPLAHDLQLEGGLSAQVLATSNPAVREALGKVRTNTEATTRAFATAAASPGDLSEALRQRVRAAKTAVDSLPAVRKGIDAGELSATDAWARYTRAVDALLEVQAGFVTGPTVADAELGKRANALVELSLAVDALSQERTLLSLAMAGGQVDRQTFGRLNRWTGVYADHIRRFRQDAHPAEIAAFDALATGAATTATASVEAAVMADAPDAAALTGDSIGFFNAMTSRLDALRDVETDAASRLHDGAAAALSSAVRKLVTYAGVLAAALAAALALAALVSRSLTGPVRRLTEAAEAAGRRLPEIVEQIQTSDAPVDTHVAPITVPSGGEIGQLADAFNTVQQVAVATAVEQASLRRSISATFVNLGRRSQTLVDRQLELIDQLENNESDPDSLNDLFALDHLATRMRRNAENLLVLAGQEPPRKWGRALPLIDVIRAAVSEVEDYPRVDVFADDGLFLAGHAASDLAHLVAELVENATAFSPPTTRVRVRVELSGERYLISVVDQGIGMTDADLAATNERLGGTSEITLTNRIGVYVIGRLARRIGAAVRLGRSSGGGVIAQVALPAALVSTSREEAAAGPGSDSDPLADSPQSARERLLGALRNVPGAASGPSPSPSSGPASGPSPAAPAAAPAARPAPAAAPAPAADGRGWGESYSGWGDEHEEPAAPSAPALPTRRSALDRDASAHAWGDEPAAPPAPPAFVTPAPAAPPAPTAAPPAPTPPLPSRAAAAAAAAPTPPATPAAPSWSPPGAGPATPPPLPPALAGAAAAFDLAPAPGAGSHGGLDDRRTATAGFASLGAAPGADAVTTAGLPQRRAGGSRRAGQDAAPAAAAPAAPAGDGRQRSPDDVRSMLSRFRSGVERGRQAPEPTATTPEDRS